MRKTGYIGGGFKPFHAGHYFIVKAAADECDNVQLYVSLADRARPGEIPIKGSVMKEIWEKYLIGVMPSNVEVEFPVSPIRAIYEKIGEAEKQNDEETLHVIFGDEKDLQQNFPKAKMGKYFPNLIKNNLIELKAFPRTSTVNISGTKMRKFIELGLKDDFIKGLPPPARAYGNEIWDLLGGQEA